MVTAAGNSQRAGAWEEGEGAQTHLKATIVSSNERVPTLVCERTKREAAAYKRGALEVPRGSLTMVIVSEAVLCNRANKIEKRSEGASGGKRARKRGARGLWASVDRAGKISGQ